MYLWVYVFWYVCMHAWMYVCTYVRMYLQRSLHFRKQFWNIILIKILNYICEGIHFLVYNRIHPPFIIDVNAPLFKYLSLDLLKHETTFLSLCIFDRYISKHSSLQSNPQLSRKSIAKLNKVNSPCMSYDLPCF